MKKLLFLLLLAVLVLGVPAFAQDDEVIEIRFVHIFQGEEDTRKDVVRAIADAFEAENPGVRIVLPQASTDYTELFNNALLSAQQGDAAHIVQVEEGLTQLAADSGLFVPISDIASEEQLATLDDVLPVVRDYFTVGETLLSVPWNTSNPVVYYNKGMFEAAGLDPDTPPATFDEVMAACEALEAVKEETGMESCINWPMTTWFVEQWMAMEDELIALPANGREGRATEMLYDSEAMQGIIGWWAELAEKGYYSYSGVLADFNGEGVAFLSGQTAISINSTAGITLIQSFAFLQGIDLGIAPLFLPNEEATNGVTVGGASLWVSGGFSEAETQAAVDFIFYLTQTANDKTWHQNSGYFPTRQSSIDELTEEGWYEQNPAFFISLEQLLNSNGTLANAGAVIGPSAEVRGILIEGVQSIIDGGETVEDALAAAKTRADAVLADYNALVD